MSSTSSQDITYVNARCHCSANKFKIPFVTSELPLATDMCHCNACRHITGTGAVHTAPMHGRPLDADSTPDDERPADLSKLSKYSVSPHLTRYFCTNCGAYLLYETHESVPPPNTPHWSVSVGSLERSNGIVEVGYHAYLSDTLDGGISVFYPSIGRKELPRYAEVEGHDKLPLDWKADGLKEKIAAAPQTTPEDSLRAHCHCGRISLSINREKEIPKPEEWWHVAPAKEGDPVRFIAGFCVCDDCRLASGSTFGSAFFTTRNNIIDNKTGQPIVLAHDEGRDESKDLLKRYQSSPKIWRDFCPTCGAKVLYYNVHRDGGKVVDIFLGMIDQEQDGVRAERWLGWYSQVMQAHNAVDETMLKDLQDGLKARLQA